MRTSPTTALLKPETPTEGFGDSTPATEQLHAVKLAGPHLITGGLLDVVHQVYPRIRIGLIIIYIVYFAVALSRLTMHSNLCDGGSKQ